ncbi:MAG: hypothetical protein R2853_12520 [Thermomicrobiales bacterium]
MQAQRTGVVDAAWLVLMPVMMWEAQHGQPVNEPGRLTAGMLVGAEGGA